MKPNVKRVIKIILGILIFIASISLITELHNSNSYKLADSKYVYIEKRNDVYLEIDNNTITPTSLSYKIYNNTNNEMYYGVNFEIEKLEDNVWKSFNVNSEWIDLAVILKAKSFNNEKAEWKNIYGELESGKYRIIKNINGIILSGEFEIK